MDPARTTLAAAAGFSAARVGVGASLERGGVCLRVVAALGRFARLLLFGGLGHATLSAPFDQGVDEREDEEEQGGVYEQADDLGPAVQAEVGAGESAAQDVEQAEVDRYYYGRPPGGRLPLKSLEHARSSSRRGGDLSPL